MLEGRRQGFQAEVSKSKEEEPRSIDERVETNKGCETEYKCENRMHEDAFKFKRYDQWACSFKQKTCMFKKWYKWMMVVVTEPC